MYDVILFDFDGTLVDTGEGILNGITYTLNKFGITVEDRASLNRFVGPPLQESFKMFYGFSPEETEKAIKYYREYYNEKGMWEYKAYDGIKELMAWLKEKGKLCIVTTSKPEYFAKKMLEKAGLAPYFTYIAGSDMEGTRTKKADVIRYALNTCGIKDTGNMVLVGDREYDVYGAKEMGIDSVGVLFGYGSREELEQAGATHIAETVEDLKEIIAVLFSSTPHMHK